MHRTPHLDLGRQITVRVVTKGVGHDGRLSGIAVIFNRHTIDGIVGEIARRTCRACDDSCIPHVVSVLLCTDRVGVGSEAAGVGKMTGPGSVGEAIDVALERIELGTGVDVGGSAVGARVDVGVQQMA